MSYILGRVPLPGHPSWIESLAAVRFNRESATLEDSCWFPQHERPQVICGVDRRFPDDFMRPTALLPETGTKAPQVTTTPRVYILPTIDRTVTPKQIFIPMPPHTPALLPTDTPLPTYTLYPTYTPVATPTPSPLSTEQTAQVASAPGPLPATTVTPVPEAATAPMPTCLIHNRIPNNF